MTAITDTAIKAAVKQAAATKGLASLSDPEQAGLELRVSKTGVRAWVLQCRDASGRPRRFALGHHPALGLAAAREACRKLREQVRQGADPNAEKKARLEAVRRAKDGEDTLASLIDVYERQRGAKLKWWAEYRRRIEVVFAKHLNRPLVELTLVELQRSADDWPSATSASTAVRYIRPVLKWAAHPGRARVARDLALITPPTTVARRKRVLSAEELSKLLPVLHASTSAYAAAHEFLMLTLARRGELTEARWRDIDFANKVWRLPETKNGCEHVVPLSAQAIALLRRRLPETADPEARVFTSDGGKLANWNRATKGFMAASGTSGWHRHDLRRTSATTLGEMGVDPHVIEAALNHTSLHSQLAATYNTARYRPQVAEALQRLADRYDVIAAAEN